MTGYPRALLWKREDVVGTELAMLDDHAGLAAEGVVVAGGKVPHTCRYRLTTDQGWASSRLEVVAEGAGWRRTVRLERGPERWRVTTGEQGELDRSMPGIDDVDRLADAVDVDLGGSPLTNTLPVRRLGLLGAPVGTAHRLLVAWVLVPTLEVVAAEQTYTALGGGLVRYRSGTFSADLALDADGYVTHYPGLATRQ